MKIDLGTVNVFTLVKSNGEKIVINNIKQITVTDYQDKIRELKVISVQDDIHANNKQIDMKIEQGYTLSQFVDIMKEKTFTKENIHEIGFNEDDWDDLNIGDI